MPECAVLGACGRLCQECLVDSVNKEFDFHLCTESSSSSERVHSHVGLHPSSRSTSGLLRGHCLQSPPHCLSPGSGVWPALYVPFLYLPTQPGFNRGKTVIIEKKKSFQEYGYFKLCYMSSSQLIYPSSKPEATGTSFDGSLPIDYGDSSC